MTLEELWAKFYYHRDKERLYSYYDPKQYHTKKKEKYFSQIIKIQEELNGRETNVYEKDNE